MIFLLLLTGFLIGAGVASLFWDMVINSFIKSIGSDLCNMDDEIAEKEWKKICEKTGTKYVPLKDFK